MSSRNPPGELTLHERRAMRRASKGRRPWLLIALIPGAVVALFVLAFAADTAIGQGKTVRNLEIAGQDISGLGPTDLRSTIADIGVDYESTPVEIRLSDRTINTTAAEAGLTIDVDATAAAVADAGRGSWLSRPFSWAKRWFTPATGELQFTATELADAPALTAIEESIFQPAVEPGLDFSDGEFHIRIGQPGTGVSPAVVLDQLPAAATSGANPIVVQLESATIPPNISDNEMQAIADEWNDLTAAGLTISADGEATRQFGAGEVRSWLILDLDGTDVTASIDNDAIKKLLDDRFGEVGDLGAPGDITIVNDTPTAEPGEPGTKCCTADSADRILTAITDGEGAVRLDLETVDRGDDYLKYLGIVELVGEFTTEHACCQGRVDNIQKLGEILRGSIIMPGDSFSVNDEVGPRTIEKGFVGGGVIYQGVFKSDVGGGISQYITTFFNAAFFAGLDFDSYQAHTIYISRYPYGREATISFPAPDFVINNSSEYPVLLWSEWTDTSISVQLYSTDHIEVEETGQATEAAGACTRVTTFRQRTYPDGSVVDDSVGALYQPSEGIGCDGKPTVPPTPTPVPAAEPTAEPTEEPTAEPESTPEPTAAPEPDPEP